eukprot:366162-Chlamydomonas_euryale.AAC.12
MGICQGASLAAPRVTPAARQADDHRLSNDVESESELQRADPIGAVRRELGAGGGRPPHDVEAALMSQSPRQAACMPCRARQVSAPASSPPRLDRMVGCMAAGILHGGVHDGGDSA